MSRSLLCDPRRNRYLKQGSKSDQTDARKLGELLHSNLLQPSITASTESGPLKELARSYLIITKGRCLS